MTVRASMQGEADDVVGYWLRLITGLWLLVYCDCAKQQQCSCMMSHLWACHRDHHIK